MKNKLKNINKKTIIGSLLVFISSLIVTSIIWGNRTFSVKTLNQIIFHLKVPMEGTDNGIYLDWFIFCVPISILIVTLQNIIVFNLHRVIKKYEYKVYCFIRKNFVKWGIICLISSLIFTIHNYDIYGYIVNAFQKTDIYEAYYVEATWNYKPSSKIDVNSFQKTGYFTVVDNDGRYEIAQFFDHYD